MLVITQANTTKNNLEQSIATTIANNGTDLEENRADLAEASKTLARFMQAPNTGYMSLLRRVGRYLIKYPMTANVMEEQSMPQSICVFVDTDHAGCAVTRRSTTGLTGMISSGHTRGRLVGYQPMGWERWPAHMHRSQG